MNYYKKLLSIFETKYIDGTTQNCFDGRVHVIRQVTSSQKKGEYIKERTNGVRNQIILYTNHLNDKKCELFTLCHEYGHYLSSINGYRDIDLKNINIKLCSAPQTLTCEEKQIVLIEEFIAWELGWVSLNKLRLRKSVLREFTESKNRGLRVYKQILKLKK